MPTRTLARALAGLAVAFAVLVVLKVLREEAAFPLPVYGEVPALALEDARGRPVRIGDLRGKVWVADFIYTRCVDTCPLQSAEMAKLQKDFAGAKDLRLVSITVDPDYDTGPVLARYAAKFGADMDRWLFLRGDRAEIARLARENFRLAFAVRGSLAAPPGIPPSVRGKWFARLLGALGPREARAHHPDHKATGEELKNLITHSARFVLLDREARIRGYYRSEEAASLQALRAGIRALLAR